MPEKDFLIQQSVLKHSGEFRIPEESPEILEKWKDKVDKFIGVINLEGEERLKKLRQLFNEDKNEEEQKKRKKFFDELIPKAEKRFQELKLSDEKTKTLLAIALWETSVKGKYSITDTLKKSLAGGTHYLHDAVGKDAAVTCIEEATLAREMAKMYGIKGEIHSLGMTPKPDAIDEKNGHFYFEADNGNIIDPAWGSEKCGFFIDIVDLIENSRTPFNALIKDFSALIKNWKEKNAKS